MCRVPVRALRPNPIVNALLSKVVKARELAGIISDIDSSSNPASSSSSPSSSLRIRDQLSITCDNCHKRIEYEVHHHCAGCAYGNYDICRECYTNGIRCATADKPSMVNHHEKEPFDGGWQMRRWSRETGEVQVSLTLLIIPSISLSLIPRS